MGVNAVPGMLQGFSQKVLPYFLSSLQTDFKKQQAPRRRIQIKTDVGFRTGIPLRTYVSICKAAWKFAHDAPGVRVPGLAFCPRLAL